MATGSPDKGKHVGYVHRGYTGGIQGLNRGTLGLHSYREKQGVLDPIHVATGVHSLEM